MQYAGLHAIPFVIYRYYELVAEGWLGRSTETTLTVATESAIAKRRTYFDVLKLASSSVFWYVGADNRRTLSRCYARMVLCLRDLRPYSAIPLEEILVQSIELGLKAFECFRNSSTTESFSFPRHEDIELLFAIESSRSKNNIKKKKLDIFPRRAIIWRGKKSSGQ